MVESLKTSHIFQSISEAFSSGHCDKLCDYIADSILDKCLMLDTYAKVEIDVAAKSNVITILGEI